MKRDPHPLRRWTAVALAPVLALLACANAGASILTANVTNPSTSAPKLDAAGTAWEPFSNAQGVPNASKSIKVLYVADDASSAAFPLNMAAAAVTLRPSTAGPVKNCTFSLATPVLTATNGNTCTFRPASTAGNTGDTLEIFYLGLLSGNIRVTATGITGAVGGHTVEPYDSDSVLPGTPPAPATAPPLSRKPARLVLVYDKSGSMEWSSKLNGDPVCGALYAPNPQCRRWNVLKRATGQMVSVAKAYQLPSDMLGVVLFDSDAKQIGGGIGTMTSTTLDAVTTELEKLENQPGGGTSIGDGVDKLLSAVTGGDNANFNNTMLVFTDGAQNTSKFVVWDGADLRLNTINSPIGGDKIREAGTQLSLCPFRLRLDDPTDPDSSSLLQNMSNYSGCGAINIATTLDDPPAGAIQYFLQVLNDTLIGDKLELIKTDKGEQAGTAGATPPPLGMSFRTSKRDLAFTLLLGWDSAFQADGRPKLTLSKDGVDFDPLQDPGFLVSGAADHLSATLRAPFCNAARKCVSTEGEWKLTVTRTLPRGNGHWNLFVIGDNASISSSYSVRQAKPGVGEPMLLTATLTEGGKPLAGLPAGTVRAFVSGPSEGLGNVLSAAKAKPGEGPPQGDAISAAGRKAQAMLADPAQRDKLLAALELGAEQGIELKETSPGVYAGEFPSTLAEGVYQVSFRIDSESGDNGAFTRVYNTDHYVQVQPDDEATAKTLRVDPARLCPAEYVGGCVRVTLRPVDAKNNLVGPGKAGSFGVKPFEGAIVGDVTDNLDGSYSLVIGYNKKGVAAPTLLIDGLVLNLPPQASPSGPRPGLKDWTDLSNLPALLQRWWWVLLLVLIAIVLLFRRRRS